MFQCFKAPINHPEIAHIPRLADVIPQEETAEAGAQSLLHACLRLLLRLLLLRSDLDLQACQFRVTGQRHAGNASLPSRSFPLRGLCELGHTLGLFYVGDQTFLPIGVAGSLGAGFALRQRTWPIP